MEGLLSTGPTPSSFYLSYLFFGIGATIQTHQEIQCHLYAGWLYEAVYEWVTERVLREDKTNSTGLTMSDPDILVPSEPWRS